MSVLGITASGRHRLPLRQCPGAGAECGLLTLAGAGAGAGLGATTAIDHTNIPRVAAPRSLCWDYRTSASKSSIRGFGLVSIVSYSRPSLMIIAPRTQFHVERPWGQRLFSIVS